MHSNGDPTGVLIARSVGVSKFGETCLESRHMEVADGCPGPGPDEDQRNGRLEGLGSQLFAPLPQGQPWRIIKRSSAQLKFGVFRAILAALLGAPG